MIQNIKDINSDAKILSIKAINSQGIGNISDLYSAIQYCINTKVSYINLSLNVRSSENTKCIKDIINQATQNGIKVIASAGNNGTDVINYCPGNITTVYTIGACDANYSKLSNSNYVDLVDYYVVLDLTSDAASKFTGYLSSNCNLNEVLDIKIINIINNNINKFKFPHTEIDTNNKVYISSDSTIKDMLKNTLHSNIPSNATSSFQWADSMFSYYPYLRGLLFVGMYDSPTGGKLVSHYYSKDHEFGSPDIPDGYYVGESDPIGTTEVYSSGLELYVHWIPYTYTVNFNANGGTGSMNSITRTVDVNTISPKCNFTPPIGYHFIGWHTSYDSSSGIPEGDSLPTLSYVNNSTSIKIVYSI